MSGCIKCGRALTGDEEALHKRLINRGATEFYCIDCLSEYIGITPEAARKKIEHFRDMGCLLFP